MLICYNCYKGKEDRNMKKICYFLFIILAFICMGTVHAEEDTTCNYASKAALMKAAGNVSANYTIKKDNNNNYYFEFSIYNITDEIYVILTNNITKEETQILSSMTSNNVYKFNVYDTVTVMEYTIHVRSFKYGCNDELRKFTTIKPRYNDISELELCKRDGMIEYTYCQQWIDKYFTETREEIIDRINRHYNRNTSTTTTQCINCATKDENDIKIKKANNMRLAIIIGILIGIIIDCALIVYLIIRLRRYNI